MAQNRILVEEAALDAAISDYQGKKAIMENSYQKLNQTVEELSTTYKGEASEAFRARFQEMYQNLSKTTQVMDETIEKLRLARDEYGSLEEAVQSLMEKIEEFMAFLA